MKKIFGVLVLLLLVGCASTKYLPFEAKQTDFDGTGGTRETVDGIDIWQDGTPPRRFRVLGIITDERKAGKAHQAGKTADLARLAKEQGGDAVIPYQSQSQFAGAVSTGNAFAAGNAAYGTGVSVPVYKLTTKYFVVKYLD